MAAASNFFASACALAASFLLFFSQTLWAADMTLQTTGSEKGSYESNPLMLLHGATPLWGSTISPDIFFKDATPTTQLNLSLLLDENIFNQISFDSTDIQNDVALSKKIQRWAASLEQRTVYDTTRTSELSSFDFNVGNIRHLGLFIAPQISYSPTSVDTINFLGSAAASRYESSAFTGYNLYSVTPGYTHNFDPRNAGVFSILAQRYQTTNGADIAIDNITPTVGWNTTLAPELKANASIGFQTTRQYGGNPEDQRRSLQYVFATDIAYQGQQDVINLKADQVQYPFGNGTEALLRTFALNEVHNLNAKFSLALDASYQTALYPAHPPSNSLNALATGSSGIIYHATDSINVSANYKYRYETLTDTSQTAQDNIFMLAFAYIPNAWAFR
jgi:hypothetical protein